MGAGEFEQASGSAYHVPVMLQEAVDALQVDPAGIYVDCTFGGGGHAREILRRLGPEGRLVAFDQDADARRNIPDDKRLLFVPQNFRHLARFLRVNNIRQVNGILADLGVSSHQFDIPGRGFSTRFDADLDMRMDTRETLTAFDILQTKSAEELQQIFSTYGEVTNSKTLAATIVEARKTGNLKTINNFRQAVQGVVKGNPNKYFAQVFQALRISVNDELGALRELLLQIPALLVPGGRVAIITFHSLEDRLVKQFFKQGAFEEQQEENPFMNSTVVNPLKVISKKPVLPGEEEIKRNPRSRSAKLRIAEKIAG